MSAKKAATTSIDSSALATNAKPEASIDLRNIAIYQLAEAARQNGLAIEAIAVAMGADAPLLSKA